MNIVSIAALCVCLSALILCVKQIRPEMGHMISVTAAVILFVLITPYVKETADAVKAFAAYGKYGSDYLEPIIKITGIAYVTQLGSTLCRDCNETALAARVEMAGKVAICLLTVPIAREAFVKITGIIR